MSKITVISYCHEAHQVWIPHWLQQLERQTMQDFNVVFVFHNWKNAMALQASNNAICSRLGNRVTTYDHSGPPIIGDVIDFAANRVETEYLAHHDLDDIVHPERLALQSAYLDANPNTDFLGTRMVGFTGEPTAEMMSLYYYEPNEPNADAIEHNQIYHCLLHKHQNCLGHTTMIYRPRDLLAMGGFSKSDVKLDGRSPDFETWKKALRAGYKFHRLPQLCALWRLDSSSIRF